MEIETLKEQYRQLLDHSCIASKTDTKGYITYVNEKFCEISGYSEAELIGNKHNIIKSEDNPEDLYADIWLTITNKRVWQGIIKNKKKNGQSYYVKSTIMPVFDKNKEIIEYIAARVDVTELIRKEKIIQEQFLDELTGIKNRMALLYDLRQNPDSQAFLLLVDIDRFSDINDYYGYDVGDNILKLFAKKLTDIHQQAYRISGNEFAVLYEYAPSANTKRDIKKNMKKLEAYKYDEAGVETCLYLTSGVSCGRKKDLYRFSHIALKENRQRDEKVTFFNETSNLESKIKDNIEIISMIKEGIEKDRFVPFYQGIVNNKTKKIRKYESLIRLKTKEKNIITPFYFLEHAKKAKLYTQLTKIMITKVLKRFAHEPYDISLNFTLEDIRAKDVVSLLLNELKKYKCGKRVIIEIVESEGIENFEELHGFIKKIKKHKCRVAIDDFGTGYSNFSYLSRLDVDFIKIDGSLIKDIETNEASLITVESILHFAKKMQIQTIAEYVENKNIYKILKKNGVNFSQGYLFSKPSELI